MHFAFVVFDDGHRDIARQARAGARGLPPGRHPWLQSITDHKPYGLGAGVGRALGVGSVRGVGVGLGVAVGVPLGVTVAVGVGVAVALGVGVAVGVVVGDIVGVGVGVDPPLGDTRTKYTSCSCSPRVALKLNVAAYATSPPVSSETMVM